MPTLRIDHRACATVLLATLVLAACRLEGRSSRAERLLSELAPALTFGERLADARRTIPALRVRHLGDPTDIEIAEPSASPQPVAVVVSPVPPAGQHESPDALVDGVEFVMTPSVAAQLRRHIATLFREPGALVCGGGSIAMTDSIVVWRLDRRGGALLTFPERRPSDAALVSRLFIYTSRWQPAHALSGFDRAICRKTT